MQIKNIIYVVENKHWVQSKRLEYLSKHQNKYNLKLVTARYFYFLWLFGMYREKNYFFYMENSTLLSKKKSQFFKDKHYNNFLASVTSHSNIGGGLDPLNPIPGRAPDEAYKLAINLLIKFKVVTVNSKLLYNFLKKSLPNIIYCPNGVDTFFYNTKRKKL